MGPPDIGELSAVQTSLKGVSWLGAVLQTPHELQIMTAPNPVNRTQV